MSTDDEIITTLLARGWTQVHSGSHYTAWGLFWGKEIKRVVRQPWKAWTKPLESHPDPGSEDDKLLRLARAVLGSDDPDSKLTLPDCEFLETPWVDELSATRGRIMITKECVRIDDFLTDISEPQTRCAIIEGQRGTGKTYLSFYLLATYLTRGRPVLFSPSADVFLLFCHLGVFCCHDASRLRSDGMPLRLKKAVIPEYTPLIFDTSPDQGEPSHAIVMGYLRLIQLCRPDEKHFLVWKSKSSPTSQAIEASPASELVACALIQTEVPRGKPDIAGLLETINKLGPFARVCYSVGAAKATSFEALHAYIASMSSSDLSQLAERTKYASRNHPRLLLSGLDCDIFVLRRFEENGAECLLPTLSSRHITGQLREHLGFASLYDLRDMLVVRKPPDGMLDTRLWLFEHLSHDLLSNGLIGEEEEDSRAHYWSQVFPPKAKRTKGALSLQHLSRPRTIHLYEEELPSPLDVESYYIAHVLPNSGFHALVHAVPFPRKRQAASQDLGHRPVTRRLAEVQARHSAATHVSARRRSSRSVAATATAAPEPRDERSPKKPRLKHERRFVVFAQMEPHGILRLTEEDIRRLCATMASDPVAEYFFVLVTLLDVDCDFSAVPSSLVNRLKWYHLQIDLDLLPMWSPSP
ncbi:hypothetical protein PENSPDRAFT_689224 [Peniophora sp. CONT]|nr:hypothetical protein PENSPDRAFT_689224 [Peniophora sp. CONT]